MTLTTYALLRLDAAKLAGRRIGLAHRGPRRGAGDQEPRQPDGARRVRAARPSFRLALTGTPVENRLEELWSLVHFTNRGLLGGRGEFAERYARPIAEGRAATWRRICAGG